MSSLRLNSESLLLYGAPSQINTKPSLESLVFNKSDLIRQIDRTSSRWSIAVNIRPLHIVSHDTRVDGAKVCMCLSLFFNHLMHRYRLPTGLSLVPNDIIIVDIPSRLSTSNASLWYGSNVINWCVNYDSWAWECTYTIFIGLNHSSELEFQFSSEDSLLRMCWSELRLCSVQKVALYRMVLFSI